MATTYDTSRYDAMYNDFEKRQLELADKQKKQTEADYNQRLKQAYISNMQDKKALNENLAKAGIRGGATETATLATNTAYQNTRQSIGQERNQAIQAINENAQSNILNYKQTNDAAKLAYLESREAEDRQKALQDAEKRETEQRSYYEAKYGGVYSISSLNKALNKAKTTTERTIILARINYLRNYKKGY